MSETIDIESKHQKKFVSEALTTSIFLGVDDFMNHLRMRSEEALESTMSRFELGGLARDTSQH